MNCKKLILGIIYAVWIALAIYQQIVWITMGTYNLIEFLWFIILVGTPYTLYKAWDV